MATKKASRLNPNNIDLTLPGTWMTFPEVCSLLGETRSTIDKWRARGVFPEARRKPNGNLMFLRVEVAAFIARLEAA